MKNKILLLSLLMTFTVSGLYAQGLFSLFGSSGKDSAKVRVKFVEGDEDAREEVLLIKIRGVIQEKAEGDSMPLQIAPDIMEQVKKDLVVARKRDQIKAIILDINSPGGEVTASDIIYHWINKLKEETEKPVVAIIGTMGASGAYYVACAADKILAHPTSIVGSIGALVQTFNVQRLTETIGLKAVTIKSERTPSKDMLSPFRDLTEHETNMLTQLIDVVYDRFVEIVAKSRKMTFAEVEKIADGGIYSSKKALEIGLIDSIGYREDALNEACKLAKIDSAALVKRSTKKSFGELLAEFSTMNSGVPALLMHLENMVISGSTPKLMFKHH